MIEKFRKKWFFLRLKRLFIFWPHNRKSIILRMNKTERKFSPYLFHICVRVLNNSFELLLNRPKDNFKVE